MNRVVEYRQERMQGDAASTDLCRPGEERPDEQIREKDPDHARAQAMHQPFEEGVPCRKLPTREPFGDDEFQEGTDEHGPQNRRAQDTTGEGAGGEIATTDTGGSQEQARANSRKRQPT